METVSVLGTESHDIYINISYNTYYDTSYERRGASSRSQLGHRWGSSVVTWHDRVEEDANLVLVRLRREWENGRRMPFSVAEVVESSKLPRDRVYGALVLLVEQQRIGAGGPFNRAHFYPAE